jgi:hypothetical protein
LQGEAVALKRADRTGCPILPGQRQTFNVLIPLQAAEGNRTALPQNFSLLTDMEQ